MNNSDPDAAADVPSRRGKSDPFGNSNFLFLIISAEVLGNPKLNLAAKIIVSKIASFPTKTGCYAGDEFFAKLCNVSSKTVGRAIQQLVNEGYLVIENPGTRYRQLRITDKMSIIMDKLSNRSRSKCPQSIKSISNKKSIIENGKMNDETPRQKELRRIAAQRSIQS